MAGRSLQELTIKDNFMFGAVMLDAEICREAIERALGIPIERVEVDREKSIVYHPKYRGVRLDAYARDEHHTCYNVEMQVKTEKALMKRSRYYHSQIDMDILLTNTDYELLPNTCVIFICDFDPFGKGFYRYTQQKLCQELPELSMEDGAHTIILSTKGTNTDDVSPELVEFLKYVETPTDDIDPSEDPFVQKLKETIKKIKADREMGANSMTLEDLIRDERKEARKEGRSEGEISKLISLICKKMEKNLSVPEIADVLEEDVDTVQRIYDIALEFAPDYDVKKIYEKMI